MQRDRGESLEVQLRRLKAYIESKENWSMASLYKDAGISAKNTNRPEFNRMMSDVKQGKLDVILCTKLDRVFRNTKDFLDITEYFEEQNIKFVCLEGNIDTSTPTGRVFSTMRAAFAQFERETTAERVRDVMKSRAEQGKWNGGIAPYGYTDHNKTLNINPNEKKVIEKMYTLYREHKSIRYVTHTLNGDGIKTRKGELWSPVSIRRILTNPFYCGQVVYNKRSHTYKGVLKRNSKDQYIISNGRHPTIISKELFDNIQTIVKQQYKTGPKGNAKYLLTGLVYCAECGTRMQGHLSKKNHAYYRCYGHVLKGKAKCSGNAIRVDTLENLILNDLKDLSINYNRVNEVLKETADFDNSDGLSIKECLKALEGQLNRIQLKRQRIFELYESCGINKTEFLERKKFIDEEEAATKKDIEVLRNKFNSTDINSYDLDATLGLCKDIKEVYDELEIIDRKELVRNLVSGAKINKHLVDYSIEIPPKTLFRQEDLDLCANSSDTGRGSWQR